MYVENGEVSLSTTKILECNATESGGGLFSAGGRTSLRNGTLISGCSAEEEGRSIFLLGGEVTYTLPAPLGRWLPNALCEVYRGACPYPSCGKDNSYEFGVCKQAACLKHRGDCALLMYDNYEVLDRLSEPSSDHKEAACNRHSTPETQGICRTSVNESWYCQTPTFVQPCNWDPNRGGQPSLLGENLYQLPLEPVERAFPYRCAAGLTSRSTPKTSPAVFAPVHALPAPRRISAVARARTASPASTPSKSARRSAADADIPRAAATAASSAPSVRRVST